MANNIGIRNRVRVGGSGFTVFTWNGQPIAFAQQISHTTATGVGTGPVAVHPMDEPYPVQVITPAAAGMGTLVLRLYELYGQRVWERLGADRGQDVATGERWIGDRTDLSGAIDLVDIFIRVAAMPGAVNVVKYIKPPIIRGHKMTPYTEEYHNCVVTNVQDGEEINVGSMELLKDITVAYTHMTRNGNRSAAWDYRDTPLGTTRDNINTSFQPTTEFVG